MSKEKTTDFLDYLVLLVKWKKFLIILLLSTVVIAYLSIFFFVDEQYTASALILPSQSENMSGLAGIFQNLPIDIGAGIEPNTDMQTYNTIIYSRTTLEAVINKFNLVQMYNLDTTDEEYEEKALKKIKEDIKAKITENNAYEISVVSKSPKKAAEITNYLVNLLNERIVNLKVPKSGENREFLGKRLKDIKNNLEVAEDSLMHYQQKSGMLDAESQVKAILDAYSTLETDLINKQVQEKIYSKILSKDSPRLKDLQIEVNEYEKKLASIKENGQPESPILALNSLPQKAINYLRYYRQVQIDNELLKFVLPLYEQAKFDEQKDVPILQVVDYAVPPVKRSFPQRTLLAAIITFGVFILAFLYILVKENESWQNSDKIVYIKNNLFSWK